jgi:hypothetical protein
MIKIVNNTSSNIAAMFNKKLLEAWETEKIPEELSDLFDFKFVQSDSGKRMIISEKE